MSMPGSLSDLPITPARDIESFVASPRDHYVVGRCFCFWQLGTATKGVIAWGEPGAEDALDMTRAFEAGARIDERHVSLVDMRRLRTLDVAAFEVIMRYMAERQSAFSKTVVRQALVHGTGAIGAAVGGFYRVVNPTYPVESFDRLDRAIEWLAPPEPTVARQVMDALRSRFVEVPDVLSRLHALLERSTEIPSLADSAQELGISTRSFQRELAEAGSSFRLEIARFRLARAEHLLAGTGMSVKAIAFAVHIEPTRLAALFRRVHGVSPAVWRSRFARVAAAAREELGGPER